MPSTLAIGLGILDVTIVGGGGGQNPQNNARWVTDAGVYIVTDTGNNLINNGKQ